VLSHFAAAALWQVRRGQRIEITAPGRRKPREGIRLHFATRPADETTVHDGIPVTTIARTLLDLSDVVQRRELRSAFRQAEQLNLGDPVGIQALTERYPRKPGIPSLKAVFEEAQVGLTVVRSELEERFQDFLLNAAFPSPATNVRIEGMEVDCAWPDQRLIVELDGRAFHGPATPSRPTAPAIGGSKRRAGEWFGLPGSGDARTGGGRAGPPPPCSGSARVAYVEVAGLERRPVRVEPRVGAHSRRRVEHARWLGRLARDTVDRLAAGRLAVVLDVDLHAAVLRRSARAGRALEAGT